MSVITLQFGQCGNQTGQALYSELYTDIKTDYTNTGITKLLNIEYIAESVNKWFHINSKGLWEVRSVLIDTEEKVASLANNNMHYIFKNVVAKSHGGCANNWAFGYCSKSNLLMKDILESFRKEVEKADRISSVIYMLGSAGGTGSGLGSRTIELLRDECPSKTIVGNVVLPYRSGEIVTQSYNTLLTLSKLYNISNAILLSENDVTHRLCSKSLALSNITFQDINSIIAQQLAATLQPACNPTISELIGNLVAHENYKLIQLRSVPHIAKEHLKFEALSTWPVLINRIKTSIKASYDLENSPMEQRRLKCIGNVLISRGTAGIVENDVKVVSDPILYVPWVPVQARLTHYHQPRSYKNLNKFLTLLSNNNCACIPLHYTLDDAHLLFSNKAYLHHYEKFGVDEDNFAEAFNDLRALFEDYKKLQ